MVSLKVSIKSDENRAGCNQYHNKIYAGDYKKIALVLLDLANFGLPIDKAIKEYMNMKKTDWEIAIGA